MEWRGKVDWGEEVDRSEVERWSGVKWRDRFNLQHHHDRSYRCQ